MNNWMRRYLEQEQGTVETEFDRDMVDALEDDGLVGVIESDMGYGDSWHITPAGRAALAALEPPSPVGIVPLYANPASLPALVNEDGPEYAPLDADAAVEYWRDAEIDVVVQDAISGQLDVDEVRECLVVVARKLAAEREAHRALVEAAEELTRAALAVHDNGWQPRDSDWLRVDDDFVVDLGRAAEDCRDALAALEENNRE